MATVSPERQSDSSPEHQISAQELAQQQQGRTVSYGDYVDDQLRRTRNQVKWVEIIGASITLAVGVLAAILLVALFDHWILPLGTAMRWLVLITLLGGIGAFAALKILPLFVRRINTVYAAHTIEQHAPTLKNSLVNLLMLRGARDGVPRSIIKAVESQAATRLTTVPVEASVDRSRIIKLGYVLLGLFVFLAGYAMFSPKSTLATVQRIASPWAEIDAPTRVIISDVTPGSTSVFAREFVTVEALINGVDADEPVTLFYSTSDRRAVDRPLTMTQPDGSLRRQAVLPPGTDGLQEGLEYTYYVAAGDARSDTFTITVNAPPRISVTNVEYEFPAYTRRAGYAQPESAAITALEGTKVTITAEANQEIKSAAIDFNCDGVTEVVMQAQGNIAKGTFLLPYLKRTTRPYTSYQVVFTNSEGANNSRPTRNAVDIIPDMSPTVDIIAPQQAVVQVPVNGSVKIDVLAQDPDFGLTDVVLQGERNTVAGVLVFEERLLAKEQRDEFKGSFEFSPAKYNLQPGDVIRYWALARDNRHEFAQLQPNVTRSAIDAQEPRRIEIVEASANNNQQQDNQQQNNANNQDNQQQDGQDKADDQNAGQGKQDGAADKQNNGTDEQKSDDQKSGDKNDQQNDKNQTGEGQNGGQSGNSADANQSQNGGQQAGNEQNKQSGESGQQQNSPDGQNGQKNQMEELQRKAEEAQREKDKQQDQGGNSGEEGNQSKAGGSGNEQQDNQQNKGGAGEKGASQNSQNQQTGSNSAAGDQNQKDDGQGNNSDASQGAGGNTSQDKNAQNGTGDQNNSGDKSADPDKSQSTDGAQQTANNSANQDKQGADGQQNKANGQGEKTNDQRQDGGGGSQGEKQDGDKADGQQADKTQGAGSPKDNSNQGGNGQGAQNQKNSSTAGDPEHADKKDVTDKDASGKAGDQEQKNSQADEEGGVQADKQGDRKGDAGATKEGADKSGSPDPKKDDSKTNETGTNPNDARGKPGGGEDNNQDGKGSPGQYEDQKIKNGDKQQDQGNEKELQKNEAPAGSTSKKESDSKGGSEGDRSGGGGKGGGQQANSAGSGGGGSNTEGQEGANAAAGKGEGETGAKAGDDVKSEGKTGKSGDEKGAGSESRQGDEQRGEGTKPNSPTQGDDQSQGNNRPPQDANSQQTGESKPGEQQQPKSDQQGSPDSQGGGPSSHGGNIGRDLGPHQGNPEPGSPEADQQAASKAADLILGNKDALLEKYEEDKDLQQLFPDKDALKSYLDNLQRLRDAANQSGEEGELARNALRQLRTQGHTGGAQADNLGGINQGSYSKPPAEYADQVRAFSSSNRRRGGK